MPTMHTLSVSSPVLGSPNLLQIHAALGLHEPPPTREHALTLRTHDGSPLSAHWFEPPGAARAVALLAPATGVPQRFYAPFARWLAERGYAVLTLDYRGMGRSAAAGGSAASMRDWMLADLPAALDAVLARAGRDDGRDVGCSGGQGAARLPVLWVGHSLGGHALPLQPRLHEVDAAIGVGAQLPSFSRWPAGMGRLGARFFFRSWLPLCVRAFGRLPGWALGGGLPLPAPAALDWSRWGGLPDYYRSEPAMAERLQAHRLQGVAQFWCIADDWVFGPEPAVRALQRAFDAAPGRAELLRLHPREVGARRLGHFGVFRRDVGPRVWSRWLDGIEAAVPRLHPRQRT
jgi:predicted alpha/beta hydrolase